MIMKVSYQPPAQRKNSLDEPLSPLRFCELLSVDAATSDHQVFLFLFIFVILNSTIQGKKF